MQLASKEMLSIQNIWSFTLQCLVLFIPVNAVRLYSRLLRKKKVKSSLQDTAFSRVYNASMKIKKLSYIDTSKFLYAVMSTNINRDKILMQITHPKIT